MMSTIRETVGELMRERGMSSYLTAADPVIRGLEARDAVICERLTDFAIEQGLDEVDAQNALAEVGLRPPVRSLASSNGGGEEAPAWAQDIITRLSRLEQRG